MNGPGVTDAQTQSYCYCHYAVEPIPTDAYIVCGECGHVYETAADLLAAYQREASSMTLIRMPGEPTGLRRLVSLWRYWLHRRRMTADRIAFCQECIHDF